MLHQKKPNITVVSYNVHSGENFKDLSDLFRNHENLKNADIILFQEIEHHQKEHVARAEHVAKALGHSFVYAPSRNLSHSDTHGLAILSRFPIISSRVVPLTSFRQPYNPCRRIALLAIVDAFGEEIAICNVHLDVQLNRKERIEQLRPALDAIERIGISRVIVAGDLNTAPVFWFARFLPIFYRNQRRALERFLHSFNYESGITDVTYTLRRWFVKLNLDGIFVRGLSALRAGMEGTVMLSDHQPVWVELTVSSES